MELEYRDNSRRGKWIVAFGIALALATGAGAFLLINNAQQQAGQAGLQHVPVVVAARPIAARKPIEADDVTVRDVPLDETNSAGVIDSPNKVIGKVLIVSVLQGQMVTTNLMASTAGPSGAAFTILGPDETVSPDSEPWRAVSITVPDDRAVGGLLGPNQIVDVFVTVTVNVPQQLLERGRYYTDKSTKITYQQMLILAKSGTFYVLKAPLAVAEEISHLQASGTASFSLALRPDQDTRSIDASRMGETTNDIIARYRLPIPENYPGGSGPTVLPSPTRTPSPSPVSSPTASGVASAAPSAATP